MFFSLWPRQAPAAAWPCSPRTAPAAAGDRARPHIDPREKHAHRLRDYIKAVEDEKWLDHLNSYDDFAKALAADTIRGTSEFLQKCRMFLECDIFYYERELRASENKCDG